MNTGEGLNPLFFGVSLVIVIVIGLITGLVQWLILRPYGISSWWVIVTGISILLFAFDERMLIVGTILQSIILWQCVSYAGIWVIANSLTPYIHDNVSGNLYSYLNAYQYEYGHLVDQPRPLLIGLLEQDVFLAMYITTGLLGGIIIGLVTASPQTTSNRSHNRSAIMP